MQFGKAKGNKRQWGRGEANGYINEIKLTDKERQHVSALMAYMITLSLLKTNGIRVYTYVPPHPIPLPHGQSDLLGAVCTALMSIFSSSSGKMYKKGPLSRWTATHREKKANTSGQTTPTCYTLAFDVFCIFAYIQMKHIISSSR